MNKLTCLFLMLFSFSLFAEHAFTLKSEIFLLKPLKEKDIATLHQTASLSFDLKKDYYIRVEASSNLNFDRLTKAQVEFAWFYEFYFFDLHPFIGYAFGYQFLNENLYNHAIYLKIHGGVLFHLYAIWKRLKIGTQVTPYLLIGSKHYLAASLTAEGFIRIEF